jgi:hypothetical protein
MKVKYLVDLVTATGPEYGKIYDVISIEAGWYRIIDQSGGDYIYPSHLFEIVDQLPEPPVLTKEDIEQGKGDMYVITDEYRDACERGDVVALPDVKIDSDVPYRTLRPVWERQIPTPRRDEGYCEVAEPAAVIYGYGDGSAV